MIFNENNGFTTQENYLMKQTLNAVNEKVGTLDGDVAFLKSLPELVDEGELTTEQNEIVFNSHMYDCTELFIDMEIPKVDTSSNVNVQFRMGLDNVTTASISSVLQTTSGTRKFDIHAFKITDTIYHVDCGTSSKLVVTPWNQSVTQGHFDGKFDNICIVSVGAVNFPTGTKWKIYTK